MQMTYQASAYEAAVEVREAVYELRDSLAPIANNLARIAKLMEDLYVHGITVHPLTVKPRV